MLKEYNFSAVGYYNLLAKRSRNFAADVSFCNSVMLSNYKEKITRLEVFSLLPLMGKLQITSSLWKISIAPFILDSTTKYLCFFLV